MEGRREMGEGRRVSGEERIKRAMQVILAVGLLLWLSACAVHQPSVPPEQALRERVTMLWQAKMNNDRAAVYEMTDKKYRDSTSLKDFEKTNSLLVKGFQIKNVEIDKNDAKKGSSMVIFQTFKFARPFEMSTKELWVNEDGQWYVKLSDPRTPFDKRTE